MEPTLDWSSAMTERGIAAPLNGSGHAVAISGIPDAPEPQAGAGTSSGVLKSVLMCSVLVGIIAAIAMIIPTTSFAQTPAPIPLLVNATTTTSNPPTGKYQCAGNNATPTNRPYPFQAFQVTETGTGAVTATVQIMASLDAVNWTNYGAALSISGTAPQTVTAFGNAPFNCWAAVVTAITGTSATINAKMDVGP